MNTAPGADEVRARRILLAALDGARPVQSPPAPPAGERPRDWLDEILDEPTPQPPAAPRLPNWRRRETADLGATEPKPPTRGPSDGEDDLDDEAEDGWEDVDDQDEAPAKGGAAPARRPLTPAVRRAHATYTGLPARVRGAAYTGSAAALGYGLGLEPLFSQWITACGHDTSTGGALALGVGLILATAVLIDRRTRGWWPPLAWACRIPLASALLAVALYAPGATP